MTLRRAPSASVSALALALVLVGCLDPAGPPDPPGPRTITGERIQVESTDELDLLFMIDDSGSLTEEQAQLSFELPRLIGILASGDRDGDGAPDFPAVRSLHVGVVTSDMGTGGFPIPTCGRTTFGYMFGGDGVLVTRGYASFPGCLASYPPVFDFVRGTTDPDAFAMDLSCVANTGPVGCGFEQQLEAVLKALSPAAPWAWTAPGYVPPVFFAESHGHADGANAGLVRLRSALAIVLLTDEEDCSVLDPELFDVASTSYPGDLNLRCWMYEEQAEHPIERYVRGEDGHAGLVGLRRDPARLVYAGIVGVPVDVAGTDYDAMLAHPDMQAMLDPDAPTTAPRLRPSCNTANGIAFPPRRMVRVAQGLEQAGARTTIQSACQSSYAGVIDAIVDEIAAALDYDCLASTPPLDHHLRVDCDVLEILPSDVDVTCDELPGRVDAGTTIVDGEERVVCEVSEGADDRSPGWIYEPGSSSPEVYARCGGLGGRIRYTTETVPGAEIHLECPRSAP